MAILQNKELGCYIPSFFEMHIDTNKEDLTITELPLKDRTVLFHEYIHFLQDFTSYYGLNNLYVHSEYLRSAVHRIYKSKSHEILVPIDIEDLDGITRLNLYVRDMMAGDSETHDNFNIAKIEPEKVNFNTDAPMYVNPYINSLGSIVLHDNSGVGLVFGATAIMESMAYIMERCCSPNGYYESPDFPYLAAEKVADYFIPGFSKNLLMVLALCDISLQHSYPGKFFVGTMIQIKKRKLCFQRPGDMYKWFYNLPQILLQTNKECSFIDSFKEIALVVQGQMQTYFKDESFGIYHEWVRRLIQFAIDWRENNKFFLLEMARCQELTKNQQWGYTIGRVGTPLMRNGRGQYFYIPPKEIQEDEYLSYLPALYEIENLFSKGKFGCSMYEWCKKSTGSSPNELCKTTPWRKTSEKRLCPYAMIWKLWGLTGYEPIHKP